MKDSRRPVLRLMPHLIIKLMGNRLCMIQSKFISLMNLTVIPLFSHCKPKFTGGILEILALFENRHLMPTWILTKSKGINKYRLGKQGGDAFSAFAMMVHLIEAACLYHARLL